MRRTVVSRFIALLVLLSGSLVAPVAALAHGVAHHREHDERDHHAVGAPANVHGAAVSDEPDARDHEHARIDGAVRGRIDASSFVPVAATLAVVILELLVPGSLSPPWRADFVRPERSTGPPPRLRSPPLR